ncbi:MAG: hypothetical protein WBE69_14905, partial [Candidatus Binataceae bacterium]
IKIPRNTPQETAAIFLNIHSPPGDGKVRVSLLVHSNIYRFKTIADGLNSDGARREPVFSRECHFASHSNRPLIRSSSKSEKPR